MQLITCASYYGSGSSALTDFVSEYKGVKSLTDYEFRFLQDIDGLVDLEYHLVKNHHRHNSGHSLKRFLKQAEFNHGTWFNSRYEPFFGGKYLEITKEYVNSLIEFSYPGHWYMDMYDRGKWYYYRKSLEGKIRSRLPFVSNDYMPNELTYGAHPTEENFLKLTKKYLENLMSSANPDNYPYLMVDQLIPSSGINTCLRYFDDNIRVVIVSRDPRDVYLSDKFVWKTSVCPRDPELFCKWFRYTHESNCDEMPNPKKVMMVNFEDLIYRYDEMVPKLEGFLGLRNEDHLKPFTGLNPKRSYGNTQLWKKFDDPESIAIIEKKLPQYLYDFGDKKYEDIAGVDVNNGKVF